MNLIKIGRTFLNLDLVRSIRDLAAEDASGRSIPGAIRFEFDGGRIIEILAGAAEFRAWVNSRAINLTPDVPGP